MQNSYAQDQDWFAAATTPDLEESVADLKAQLETLRASLAAYEALTLECPKCGHEGAIGDFEDDRMQRLWREAVAEGKTTQGFEDWRENAA